ncbi:ComF family protein [Geomobilimonas luticola]|uniref:ComF family protein n=1 Tax=Geomobilimonas luticola TaxID=1114878 RepID=A0ABS5S8A0_9BACT|nr:ComF family protein [Geomobilimonas luticola]MBT0651600.1 ComF family protein [Geomobilimonas luticola]
MLRAFLDILFPPLCHVCRSFIPAAGPLHICSGCRDAISPISSPLCDLCGTPFGTIGGSDHRCGACSLSPPRFDAARAATLFDGPVRDMIHRFKYDRRVQLARPLGLLAAETLASWAAAAAADLVVPVPLHVRRLRQRGFNQAILLGQVVAGQWHLPLDRTCLRRIRWTEPQVNLAAAERAANVRGAFAVTAPARVAGRRIILVDDVFTTGSTVAECARVLKGAGAGEVLVVTVARAVA